MTRNEYMRKWRADRVAKGFCRSCSEFALPGLTTCENHREMRRQAWAARPVKRGGGKATGPREDPVARFWRWVDRTETCWNWKGKTGNQYGHRQTWWHTKYELVHRVSWKIHHGEIPEGMMVCHHCDNPKCVRPDHLFLGDAFDNMRDMVKKGRDRWSKARVKK